MTILRRISKLEELVKPLVDKIERKKEELKKQEESFELTNQIMKDFFPEHRWNKLDEKTKLQLENSEEILILTIEYFWWIEKNYDKPSYQMEALWKKHKTQALEKVKRRMKI
jgi:hypothetical protein